MPMLLPSLSSKSGYGKPIPPAPNYFEEILSGPALISAYDLHYGLIEIPSFASVIFLDSGGYEAICDVRAANRGDRSGLERYPWSEPHYQAVLNAITLQRPVVAVSFDHPEQQLTLADQLDRADRLFPARERLVPEFLIKPEPDAPSLDLGVISTQLPRLAKYPLIGVTDKELGETLWDKLLMVARLRQILSEAGIQVPIHVFGSLDPLTAPLYFIAGADVFDGLAWLKYAFSHGRAIYSQNFEAIELSIKGSDRVSIPRMWQNNYTYMAQLEDAMRRFLQNGDFKHFEWNADLLANAWINLDVGLKD